MTFGFADLCLMRIANLLMDRGFTFESANAVVSRHAIWSYMRYDSEPVERYLLIWPPYGDHIVFDTRDLHLLPARTNEAQAQDVITLLNLAEVQHYVANQLMRPEKPEKNRYAMMAGMLAATAPKVLSRCFRLRIGGDGGIRTLGTVSRTTL